MAQGGGQEKTEQATPKRRRDARKEGNVFQSRDVATVVILIGIFFSVKLLLPYIYAQMRGYMIWIIQGMGGDLEDLFSARLAWATLAAFLKCALPLLGIALVCGVLAQGSRPALTYPLRPSAQSGAN